MTTKQPAIPFSLECTSCDDGTDIDSPEAAFALGWLDIVYDDGLGWNYLGTCLACQEMEKWADKDRLDAHERDLKHWPAAAQLCRLTAEG